MSARCPLRAIAGSNADFGERPSRSKPASPSASNAGPISQTRSCAGS
jgi:hypothetical protein